jgi:hypothetical protein
MSIRQNQVKIEDASGMEQLADQAQSMDASLGEGTNFNVVDAEHPLKRSVVVSIKASLNDLCLQKQRATWAPSPEALKSICKLMQPASNTHTPRPDLTTAPPSGSQSSSASSPRSMAQPSRWATCR